MNTLFSGFGSVVAVAAVALGCGNAPVQGATGGATTSSTTSSSSGTTSSGTGGGCPGADLSTDAKNCGACGHDCLGAPCTAAVCQPITLAMNAGANLALDATHVYWTCCDHPGWARTVPKAGGPSVQLSFNVYSPLGIAVDANNAYWADGMNAVDSMPKGGGAYEKLATGTSSTGAIATDGTSVYWQDTGNGGAIMKVATQGGTPAMLAVGTGAGGIAVDATSVYWTGGSVVSKVPIAGGSVVTLVTGQNQPSAVAVDAAHVYWTAASSVWEAPLAGGTPVMVASMQQGATGVAVDATHVYWTAQMDGTVMKAPIAGGAPVSLATGLKSPSAIAVDATAVYWTDTQTGALSRVAK